jgi:hypothetical protein
MAFSVHVAGPEPFMPSITTLEGRNAVRFDAPAIFERLLTGGRVVPHLKATGGSRSCRTMTQGKTGRFLRAASC